MKSIKQNGLLQSNLLNQGDGFLESSQKTNCLSEKTNTFIKKANVIHNDKYIYTKTVYESSQKKVVITCPHHGDFHQTPNKHLSGKTGCPTCAKEKDKKRKQNIRINSIKKWIHALTEEYSTYTYSHNSHLNQIYVDCPQHGTSTHNYVPGNLNKYPCKKCGIEERSKKLLLGINEYINKARALHNGVYEYITKNNKLYAVCKEHGEFELSGNRKANHIHRLSGCKKCKSAFLQKKFSHKINFFIEQSNMIHHHKYTYDNVVYINIHKKIIITCPQHGNFEQSPLNHLQGAGCPRCKLSMGEKILMHILQQKDVCFVQQKTFDRCVNPETGRRLRFDFFLPNYNTLIEIDGIQHFTPVSFSKTTNPYKEFENTVRRDKIKNEFAHNNNLLLLRIPYTDFNIMEDVVQEIINSRNEGGGFNDH